MSKAIVCQSDDFAPSVAQLASDRQTSLYALGCGKIFLQDGDAGKRCHQFFVHPYQWSDEACDGGG